MILKKCRIWSVILRKMPGPEYQRVKNQNAVVKNEGILDFQCVGDFVSPRQKQTWMDLMNNVPDTSGICPGCLDNLPFGYLGCQPAASAVIYSPRRGPSAAIDYHVHTLPFFPPPVSPNVFEIKYLWVRRPIRDWTRNNLKSDLGTDVRDVRSEIVQLFAGIFFAKENRRMTSLISKSIRRSSTTVPSHKVSTVGCHASSGFLSFLGFST